MHAPKLLSPSYRDAEGLEAKSVSPKIGASSLESLAAPVQRWQSRASRFSRFHTHLLHPEVLAAAQKAPC